MIKSLAVASLLVTAIVAQNPASNPLIPSGISTSCSNFLQTLDADPSFSCLTNLVSVLSAFAPGHTASSSATSLASSLDTLCSTSSCSNTFYRTNLANFQAACPNELMSAPNTDVVKIYDAIYTLKPLQEAVCLKDSNGQYCVVNPPEVSSASSASSTTATHSASAAASSSSGTTHAGRSVDSDRRDNSKPPYKVDRRDSNSKPPYKVDRRDSNSSPPYEVDRRDANSTQVYSPNESNWTHENIAFLLLQPDLPANLLCTPCTREIFGAWIQFESNAPYAPGIPQSSLLSGQTDLYNAIQSKCGASFLSGAVQAAGGISNGGPLGGSSSSSTRSFSVEMLSSVVVILASFAVGSAAMF